jgi:hypothetical protein
MLLLVVLSGATSEESLLVFLLLLSILEVVLLLLLVSLLSAKMMFMFTRPLFSRAILCHRAYINYTPLDPYLLETGAVYIFILCAGGDSRADLSC